MCRTRAYGLGMNKVGSLSSRRSAQTRCCRRDSEQGSRELAYRRDVESPRDEKVMQTAVLDAGEVAKGIQGGTMFFGRAC